MDARPGCDRSTRWGRGAGAALAKKGRARYCLTSMGACSPWGGQGSRGPARRPQPVRDDPHPTGPRPDLDRDQGRRADQRLGRRSSARPTTICLACWPTRTRTLTVRVPLPGPSVITSSLVPASRGRGLSPNGPMLSGTATPRFGPAPCCDCQQQHHQKPSHAGAFSQHRGRGGPLPSGQPWHLCQGRLHAARLVATPMLPARRTAGHRAAGR